ncbi:NADPH-dependent FMN reductase [Nocardia sp. NPDC052278]|uniref:NADPH-dependent FMN reductase n=1 Tax=Nocardia sp. NPDC052278 TaxID=3364328 RepID=UPI0037C64713
MFATPEYNCSFPASLKNAIDYLYREWNDKAAGVVTYGRDGGIRAAEQLRLVLAEVKVATVRSQVSLSLFTDFTTLTDECTPGLRTTQALFNMMDELIAWSTALATLRVTLDRQPKPEPPQQ